MDNTCKNCHATLLGAYCKDCGQKAYGDADKNLKHIASEAFHFTTHFEGTFFTTLTAVLTKPGKLSHNYCNGIRKKYYKPISFFLILIVIYLIFPVIEGLNMRMAFYKTNGVYGTLVTEQIDKKVIERGMSEERLAEIFHEKSEKTSKIMLLLLIPLTAGALWVLYFHKKLAAFDYFILATEINIFTVLIIFLLWPLLVTILFRITGVVVFDAVGNMIVTGVYFTYIVTALTRFFSDRWYISLAKAILFVALYGIVTQIIYKFILFELTFLLV
jgi:hypothetical protein